MDILIIAAHQTYLKDYAGGYVRLKELLKRIPADLDYKIIDVSPSIYEDIVKKERLLLFDIPLFIKFFIRFCFPLGVLFERLWMSFVIYKLARGNMRNKNTLIYVPLGELPHLYLPAVFLKRRFSQSKLIVDILNFGVVKDNIFQLTKRFNKNSNLIISFGLALFYQIHFLILKNTIAEVDYIFTVSKELIAEIKKIYPNSTIDYTPSGINVPVVINKKIKKKYLGVYVGRVTEQKGIYNLLEIWMKVVKEDPKAKLAIAGFMDLENV